MDDALLTHIIWMFVSGTGIAVALLVITNLISTLLAALLMLLDIYGPRWLSVVIRTYSWLAQTTPPLVLLLLAFFGFTAYGFLIPPFLAAVIAFTFFSTAYNFEVLRASFEGIPKDQFEAARALGIPLPALLQRVVLPQLVPIAAIPYIGRATVLLKETSLASAISVPEIMNVTNGLIYANLNPLLLISVAAAIYIVLNLLLIACEGRLQRIFAERLPATESNS